MSEAPKTPPAWADLPAFRHAHQLANGYPTIQVVPAELRERRQWLVWRYEPGETPEKKPRKMPYYADGGRRAGGQGSERDRARLVAFKAADEFARLGGDYDGVGFAFLPDDGLVGVDLDGMIDPETGAVSSRLEKIVQACASYTEYSPSGKGVHIICLGEAVTTKSNAIGVELFCGRQYFTFTGRRFAGGAEGVRVVDPAVLRRIAATVAEAKKGARAAAPAPAPAAAPSSMSPSPEVFGGRERSLAETVALVEEALATVPPDEYEDWISVGMACKAGLGAAGYVVWDAWSARSEKYAGAEDTRKRFEGFAPTQVTLGTVFGLAAQHGWVAPWEKAKARRRRGHQPPRVPGDPPVSAYAEEESETSAPTKAAAGGWDGGGAGAGFADSQAWRKALLVSKTGGLVGCLANVYDVLLHSEAWAGVLGFDEFAQQTVKLKPPPYYGGEVGAWTAADDSRTAIWLTRYWRFAPPSLVVMEAVETLALANTFHPVRDWLRALPRWDGTERLPHWLIDYLDVPDTPYARLVSRYYLVGMVARVMQPGVKFDYCLTCEGSQGVGKSSAGRVLAGEWFGDTDLDLNNKDAMSALRGKWLYEFAEMGSVTRSEASRQKSFLSRQFDEFRPVYGRREIRLARQVVFFGTTNEWEWNKDPTGGRRFWPVEVGAVNLAGLAGAREQLFAEALRRFETGERFWPDSAEQRRLFDPEQLAREQHESLIDALHDWVFGQVADFSIADAVMEGLKLDASKLTRDLQTRVGVALRKLGCAKVEKRNGMIRYWYRPPVRSAAGAWAASGSPASEFSQPAQRGSAVSGAKHAPF